jgi:hypothetical protein
MQELRMQQTPDTHPVATEPARWAVPVLYGLCVLVILLTAWQFHRRLEIAEEVAARLQRAQPQDLEELQTLLGERVATVRIVDEPTGRLPTGGAVIELRPRVWLEVWVDLEPDGEQIRRTRLIYGSSEVVPLSSAREALPAPPPWYALVAVVIAAGVYSWLWLIATRDRMRAWIRSILIGVCMLFAMLYMAVAGMAVLHLLSN